MIMRLYKGLPLLGLCVLSSCSTTNPDKEDNKKSVETITKIVEVPVYIERPSGSSEDTASSDNLPSSTLNQNVTRPGLRDLDLSSSLPLNLDGSATQTNDTQHAE